MLFDNTLKQRTDALTVAIGEGAQTLDKTMKDRTEAFTGLVSPGRRAVRQYAETAHRRAVAIGEGATLDKTMKDRTEPSPVSSQGAVLFDNTLKQRTDALTVAIGQGAGALDKTLKDRTESFITLVSQGAVVLDKTLADRTGQFNAVIDQKAALMDRQLQDRTAQFLTAINQGAIALDQTLAERAETFTNSLFQRVKALETAISQQTETLDRTMTERAQAVIIALAERLEIDRRHVRPAHRRNRQDARRACAGNGGDLRQADGAAQSGARQQLGRDSADRKSGRRAVEGSRFGPYQSDADTARGVARIARADPRPHPALRESGTGHPHRRQGARFVEHQDRLDPGRPAPGDHRPAAHGEYQGRKTSTT